MSLAFLTKPMGGSKKGAAGPDEPKEPKQGRAPKVGPIRGGAANINVGGAPRVDLMPPEIRTKRSQLRVRRSLRLALFGVAIVVIVGCGATWLLATVAQTTLSSAQAQQQQLIAQQATYSDVTSTQKSIALTQAAQKVGDSSEIDWQAYLDKLQATLPAGTTISTVAVTSATPMGTFGQASASTPLQGARVATIIFTVASPSLPSVPQLLDGLKTLPGFVDATPGSLSRIDTGGYTVNLELHIGTQAFANRFDQAAADANEKAIKATEAAATQGGN
jgi:hypothetical protein